jgi:hypothetical protein
MVDMSPVKPAVSQAIATPIVIDLWGESGCR